MNSNIFSFRKANSNDFDNLKKLYLAVSRLPGGIARVFDEITPEYIHRILTNSLDKGLIIVSYLSENPHILVGSVHAYQLEPKVFRHILSELTIVVHSDFQGKGVGKMLFNAFLEEIKQSYPFILRVELIARESNQKGISLYKKLGFTQEGRLEKRIKSEKNILEADIPMAWFNPNYKN